MFWGDRRMGSERVRIRRSWRLKVSLRRYIAIGITSAFGFGIMAATWYAVPAYGNTVPASAAPKTEAPSPTGLHAPAEAFLRSAEALYDAAVRGDTFQTRLYLRQTEAELRALPMQRIATAEGIEALAQSVSRMKRTVAAVSTDPQNWKDEAAEIRLAADALAHPEAPLWHQYRRVLGEDVASLSAAIQKAGVSSASLASLNRLKAHYELIRTSVLLHSETFLTERADSVLRYAQRLLVNPNTDPRLLTRLTPSLQESMEGLFPVKEKDQAAVVTPLAGPPWGWSAFMGTFIVSVLTWVGWRRYQRIDRITPRETLPQERHERR
ncbi:MAG: hypothetical protein JWR03_1355 [Cohnella sp.]|nr:hypothetical protein [Cohnella sp.]